MNSVDGPLLLGLDAGGSSTVAWLAALGGDGWTVLGQGKSGPGNPSASEKDMALANLDAAIEDAFRAGGRRREAVDAACLAIAGVDRESTRSAVEAWCERRGIAAECLVVHDAAPLLAHIADDQTAIALISGTGSFAWGRSAQGATARAGGWGPLVGDEGSGYWIGLQGVRAALRSLDGRGPATSLCDALAGPLGITDWIELPAHLPSLSRDRIAALAPLVIASADGRDAVAREILKEAARQLAELVGAVALQLSCLASLDQLVLAGSVLLASEFMQSKTIQWLEQHGLDVQNVERVEQPVRGALELARRALLR